MKDDGKEYEKDEDTIDPNFLREIGEIAKQLTALTDTAVSLTEPEVDDIIRRNVTDAQTIERMLDRLLDYAGMSERGLFLFKRLLRYYYKIDPNTTAEYIYIYKDLYDSDEDDEDM